MKDLSKIHDKVIDLYVNQLYSANKVAEVLSNSDFPVQNNACAICKISFYLTKVYIDHDHKTGKFRGLLCNRCNVALGYIESSLIDEMLIYLGRS